MRSGAAPLSRRSDPAGGRQHRAGRSQIDTMAQAPTGALKKTPLNARHRRLGRGWSRSAAGTCRSSTPASPTSTWRSARAPGCSTSATWARSRSPARTRSPPSSASRPTTRRSSRSARRSTPALLDAAGHVRRRPARLPARPRRTSCWSSTPANIAEGLRLDRRAHQAGVGDAVAVDASSRYALLALQGPAARDVLQPLTGVDLGAHQVLLVRARRGRQRARDDLAHRLHRRGRLRNLRAAAVGRPRVAGDPASRARPPASFRAASARATRCGSRRRCASTATTSTRRRPSLEADLGWIVGWKKDDFIGADVLREQKAERRAAQARRLRDARARHRAATATTSTSAARRSASSPAARRRRS